MMSSLFHRLFLNTTPEVDTAAFERLNALSPRLTENDGGIVSEFNPEDKTIICRETIVNRQERVVGHEFMLKKNITERVHIGHAMRRLYDQALVSQLISLPLLQLLGQRFALVHIAAEHIFESKVAHLAGQHCMFVLRFVDESVSDELIEQVKKLRKKGVMIGILAHECLNAGMERLVDDVDMLVLDLHEEASFSADIAEAIHAQPQWPLLACHIDSYEAFDAMWESTLYGERVCFFQGPFISSRDAWGVNPTPALRFQVLRLLDLIDQEAPTQVLVDALKADPVLLYKLLRMNKASSTELIGSAEHALLSVGRETLHQWLTFMAHSQMPDAGRDLELLKVALQRARLMQLIAQSLALPQAEQVFLTGILSLMGALLQQPLADTLKAIDVPREISAALLTRSGLHFPYLQLACAVETQDFHTISQCCQALHVSALVVKEQHAAAAQWAESVLYHKAGQ
ncbi:HDOD domain-containing protein [Deefgea tanakiae]|uniref:HDOD domain-containing protein n=1 Tax=Deefgea tanakiae TaxID=2865840 RepID=A0ABX8Z4C5_9NEIS|nr:HDOD domain-containing protein [Deefgea tanakiae]QZA77418.1 HDOD domain-containing protein [Deefgea tanakiae]